MYVPELIRKEGLRRGLRPRTISTYQECIKRFFRRCRKDPKEVSKNDIKDFLDNLLERRASGSTVNVYLNALKFFYEQVLNKRLTIKIRFSKQRQRMPTVLTKEEIVRLVNSIENKKHKLLVKLMYSYGFRVNEALNLKAKDFDIANNKGTIIDGKGGKDRLFVIAETLKKELMDFIADEGLDYDSYLFSGRNGKFTAASVREILKKARRKADIRKMIHPHALRHSFATHSIDNGCSWEDMKNALGHSSLETTFHYVHTLPIQNRIRSPLDELHFN